MSKGRERACGKVVGSKPDQPSSTEVIKFFFVIFTSKRLAFIDVER